MKRTYTVEWSRPGSNERLRCTGLTPRLVVARLIGALKRGGWVRIWKVTPE